MVYSLPPPEDGHEAAEGSQRRAADDHRAARAAGEQHRGVRLHPESDQRHARLVGSEAGIPALRPTELRSFETDATRHQHARRNELAGPSDADQSVEQGGRAERLHRRVPRGDRHRAESLVHGRSGNSISHAGREIHLGFDRHARGGVQHRRDADLCEWAVQRRRHGVRAVLHAVRPDRRDRRRVGRAITAVDLVYGLDAGADDRLSWDSRSHRSLRRRQGVDGAQAVSRRPDVGGELGATESVRTESRRLRGRPGCQTSRIPLVRGQRRRGAVYHSGRRAPVARRPSTARVAGRPRQSRHRRHE